MWIYLENQSSNRMKCLWVSRLLGGCNWMLITSLRRYPNHLSMAWWMPSGRDLQGISNRESKVLILKVRRTNCTTSNQWLSFNHISTSKHPVGKLWARENNSRFIMKHAFALNRLVVGKSICYYSNDLSLILWFMMRFLYFHLDSDMCHEMKVEQRQRWCLIVHYWPTWFIL